MLLCTKTELLESLSMLKVLLVDAQSGRSAMVRAALEDAGYAVVTCVAGALDLYEQVAKHHPDVVLADANSPARDVLEHLLEAGGRRGQPLLMLTRTDNPALPRLALEHGVAAYSVDGLSPSLLRSMIELAVAQFRQEKQMRAELEKAKRTLEGRKVVDRAKAAMMREQKISEDEAYRRLREGSMQSGLPIGEIALRFLQHSGETGTKPA